MKTTISNWLGLFSILIALSMGSVSLQAANLAIAEIKALCDHLAVRAGPVSGPKQAIESKYRPHKVTAKELGQLNNEKLALYAARHFNRQLSGRNLSFFMEILNDPVVKDKQTALNALYQMSQFGNMSRIFELVDHLKIQADQNNWAFLSIGRGTTADSLAYLTFKSRQPKGHYRSLRELQDKGLDTLAGRTPVIIADMALQRLLQKDSRLAKELKENNVEFVFAEGLEGGLTPFVNSPAVEFKTTFQKLYRRIEQKGSAELNQLFLPDFRHQLESLGFKTEFHNLRYDPEPAGKPTLNQIMSRANPRQILPEDILQAVEKLPPKDKRMVLEILYTNGHLKSLPYLSDLTAQMHQQILQRAAVLGKDANSIYFYLPIDGKSYQLVAQIYGRTNKVPAEKFVHNIKEVPKDGVLVILDDFAGSGESLTNAQTAGFFNGFKESTIIAPIFTTVTAIVQMRKRGTPENIIWGEYLPAFKETPFYQSLPTDVRLAYDNLSGGGYAKGSTNIAFSYMSPDNNNAFFSRYLSALYTLRWTAIKY